MIGCKCGARTYKGHLKKCADGYPDHVYKGTDVFRIKFEYKED